MSKRVKSVELVWETMTGDLRLRVVKAGPGGEVEVAMKRWGQIQALSFRQRPWDMLMPKFMGYSKSSFKRDFSQKNAYWSWRVSQRGMGWGMVTTAAHPGDRVNWRQPSLELSPPYGHWCWWAPLLPAQLYAVFKYLVWLDPYIYFIQKFLW